MWITGAAGFSGVHLRRFLRTHSHRYHVIGLDYKPAVGDDLDLFHRVDLTDIATLRRLVRSCPPELVIHLAGLLPPVAESDLWRVNVGGTLQLLLALAEGAKRDVRVLSIGSAAEYRHTGGADRAIRETDPVGGETPYGRSKWAQSTLALAFAAVSRIEVIVARVFNLIGPGLPTSLAPGALCAQFANSRKTIRVRNLDSFRDFIDIRDAVSAYWTICKRGISGSIYNVCTGSPVSIRTVLHLFSGAAGVSKKIQVNSSRPKLHNPDCVYGDNTKLRGLGWSPTVPLQRSIDDMLNYARS